jgi:small-conductance mechanosensitive channel
MEILHELALKFAGFVPNLTGAILLLLAGFIISKLVSKFLGKLLLAIKVDRLGEKLNEIDLIRKSGLEIQISTIIAKLAYYFMFLVFLMAATDVLNMPAISKLMSDFINYIPSLIVGLFILIFGLIVSENIRRIILTICKSLAIPSAKTISSAIFYFLFLTVLLSALEQAKIQTSFLSNNITLLIGGVVLAFALGYGYASKDMMTNFVVALLQKHKFKKGDRVRIGNFSGVVTEMDNNSLTLTTDEKLIVIPLNKLSTTEVEIFIDKQ